VPLSPDQLQSLQTRLAEEDHEEVRQMTTVWHDMGRAEGRVEGRVEGRGEGIRHTIARLLESRLGEIPPGVYSALEQIQDDAALVELAVPAATVGSLEEFARMLPPVSTEEKPS
jgi:predicted transposase YdaD